MKLNKLSLGIVAACGLMSSSAFALDYTSYTNSTSGSNVAEFNGDTVNIRLSGATAQDPGILAATLRFCTAGSMTAYSITNNFVYFCTINTTTYGAPVVRNGVTPTKLAVYKYSVGGSGAGVGLVNNASNVPFLDLTKMGACAASGTNINLAADADGDATNLATYAAYTCTAGATALQSNAVSYIGISDVEPAFFGAPSTYANLSSAGLATVIFGLPVTKNVYNALQAAQSLTVGSMTEANMPSLSQGQITSMLTQEGQTWSGLGTGITLTDDQVYVARRVNSSGTQKTFEAVIARTINGTLGGRNCQSGVSAFVSGPEAANNTVVTTVCNGDNPVVNGSGSGQVLSCLEKHNDADRGAVGVMTTETKVSTATKYAFVKINGLAPTQANVAKGLYTQYGDASVNTRTSAPVTATADNYANFLIKFKAAFVSVDTIKVINGADQPFGASGLMAQDKLTSPVPTANYTGAAGNPWTRVTSGSLNNCQPGRAANF